MLFAIPAVAGCAPEGGPWRSRQFPHLRIDVDAALSIFVQSRAQRQSDRHDGRVIATWGQARLLKNLDGACKLVGGSVEDRAEAQKWVAMFMPRDRVEGLPPAQSPPEA